jgi:5'(3')-deoxyribonucleotidase
MIKDKQIVLDLDNTIINTPKTIINLHNKLNPNKQYNYTNDIQIDWKFRPVIKSDEELSDLFKLFDHEDFYKDVVVFPNAIEVINRLSENNEVVICSKHMDSRKPLTKAWINKVMPKASVVFVDSFADKGSLFTNCDVAIDDRIDCLNSFNDNVYKICFGKFKWNQEWNGIRCNSWSDIMLSLNTMYYFKHLYPQFSDIDKMTFKQEYKCQWIGDNNGTK